LELGALSKLIKMVKSSSIEEAIKALYAVSTSIQNNLAGQEFFYAEDGDAMLQVLYEVFYVVLIIAPNILMCSNVC
jgi:nucleotide exchange factor SIL1